MTNGASGRWWGRFWMFSVAIGLCAALSGRALAGEEDDLQLQIDTQRASANDLERLDELKAVGDEIAVLRSWLDEAWNLRAKHEYDEVRVVLDRAIKQEDLIRAKISVSKLRAQEQKHEASLKELRDKIAHTRKALQDTIDKKKALERSSQ